jgi:hypothetical protein
MKNIYEVFDEFEAAQSKKERMDVIQRNLSKTLVEVLELTFHPEIQWKIKDLPENYQIKPIPAGMSYCQLSTELRKLYMFRAGHPTAEKLTPRKTNELLLQLLEGIEPREAEVVMGIFNKNQGVKGLDYKFVKEAFPNLLP